MGTEEERLKVEYIVDNAAHLFDLGGDMSGEPAALVDISEETCSAGRDISEGTGRDISGETGRFSFFFKLLFFPPLQRKNAQHAPLECKRRL